MADYNATIDITEQLKNKPRTPDRSNENPPPQQQNEEKKISAPEPIAEPNGAEPPKQTDLSLSSSLTTSMKQFLQGQDDFIWCPVPGCRFVFENSGPGEEEVKNI